LFLAIGLLGGPKLALCEMATPLNSTEPTTPHPPKKRKENEKGKEGKI